MKFKLSDENILRGFLLFSYYKVHLREKEIFCDFQSVQ